MSACPIILESPHSTSVGHSPHTAEFDGQMWLDAGNVLAGRFRYFSTTEITFEEIGYKEKERHT